MMKLALEKKHENKIEFLADKITTGFANMIRRYAMSRVAVLAINNVTFYDNSSAFWDEYLAHRLGLMPVLTPPKTPESAEIVFSLDATGPKTVCAGDLTCADKSIKIAKDNIILLTLGENQRLRLEGRAVLNVPKDHAKFQPGLVAYGERDNGKIKLVVETFYQMPPSEIIIRGCEVIESDIDKALKTLGKKPSKSASKKTVSKKSSKPKSKKK